MIINIKKNAKIIALTLSIFLLTNSVFASDLKKVGVEKVDLTFEQAYELMMANNNAIKASLEEINAKKYEKKAAVGEYFPKIGLNTTYVHLANDITVDTPPVHIGGVTANVPSILIQDENLWTAGGGAVWNIFTGGKIVALNSAARAKLEGTNQKYKALTNDLTAELVKRYYGLKFAQDVATVRMQVMETTRKHFEDAKKLEQAGIVPKSERLHAEVAFSQAEIDYDSALRDVEIVQDGLKTLIKSDKVDLRKVEIYPSSYLFVYKKEFDKLDIFKDIALQNNPKLKQTDVMKKIAQADYNSKKASYAPTVSLFAYDIFASSNLSYQVPHWSVGAAANWTLFDGLSRYNKMKAAECVNRQVNYEALDAKNNIESLVTKQYEELMKYKEQYESTNKSIESANEALRTSTLAFNEGLGTSLAVTDAQTALSGIKIERLKSIYDYDVVLTQLLGTKGNAEDILDYIKNSTKEKL